MDMDYRIRDYSEKSAKSADSMCKFYTTQLLYIGIKQQVSTVLLKAFTKLLYVNSDNFCVIESFSL